MFRRYIDFGVIDGLRQMKACVPPRCAARAGGHIKLGAGGIREVEFIAQALQLIRGGRVSPALGCIHLPEALAGIAQNGASTRKALRACSGLSLPATGRGTYCAGDRGSAGPGPPHRGSGIVA